MSDAVSDLFATVLSWPLVYNFRYSIENYIQFGFICQKDLALYCLWNNVFAFTLQFGET